MTIDDFKVGMRVKHEKYGEGEVLSLFKSPYYPLIIRFKNNNYNCEYGFLRNDVGTIQECNPIINNSPTRYEQLKKIYEETMQEFEPITKENIEEVLKYNDWEYDSREIYDEFPVYNCPDVCTPYYISIRQQDSNRLEFYLSGIDDYEGDSIITTDFNEFLTFVQKRVELKPIPKKPEFDFERYLKENGFKHKYSLFNLQIYIYTTHFESLNNTKYAKTKENADILIAAAKLLEGLK